jgi:hypothetical protein
MAAIHSAAYRRLLPEADYRGYGCLLLEGVLDLLAGAFELRLRLVVLAPVFGAPVAGDPADHFFGLTAELLGLVLGLIRCAHCVCSYFAGIVRVADCPEVGVPRQLIAKRQSGEGACFSTGSM